MRISDWSSDVCSSDLLFEQLIGPVIWDFADVTRMEPGLAPEMLHLQVVHPLVGIARGRYFGKRRKAFRIARAVQFVADRLIDRVEIGRASCRERVCQYV